MEVISISALIAVIAVLVVVSDGRDFGWRFGR